MDNIKPINEFLEDYITESYIQNLKEPNFDASNPDKIEIYNQGVGGVRSLKQHRKSIVNMLEKMLKHAKKAEKDHRNSYDEIDKILSIADPDKMSGVFLYYLRNHQSAIEELENKRKRGGSGNINTIPKNK